MAPTSQTTGKGGLDVQEWSHTCPSRYRPNCSFLLQRGRPKHEYGGRSREELRSMTHFSLPSPTTAILLLSSVQAMSLIFPAKGWYSYFRMCSFCVVSQILSFPEISAGQDGVEGHMLQPVKETAPSASALFLLVQVQHSAPLKSRVKMPPHSCCCTLCFSWPAHLV